MGCKPQESEHGSGWCPGRERASSTGGDRHDSSPENGLRILARRRSGRRTRRLRVRIGTSLGLTFATLQILAQLCGQSLLTLQGLGRFGHGTSAGDGLAYRSFLVLRRAKPYGSRAAVAGHRPPLVQCCRSSVVEHPLGKGEADSSILSGSTIHLQFRQKQVALAPRQVARVKAPADSTPRPSTSLLQQKARVLAQRRRLTS